MYEVTGGVLALENQARSGRPASAQSELARQKNPFDIFGPVRSTILVSGFGRLEKFDQFHTMELHSDA